MNVREVRRLALALPEATEEPHFHLASFRVKGKIFATVAPDGSYMNVFVDDEQRELMVTVDPKAYESLKWGKIAYLHVHIGGRQSQRRENAAARGVGAQGAEETAGAVRLGSAEGSRDANDGSSNRQRGHCRRAARWFGSLGLSRRPSLHDAPARLPAEPVAEPVARGTRQPQRRRRPSPPAAQEPPSPNRLRARRRRHRPRRCRVRLRRRRWRSC